MRIRTGGAQLNIANGVREFGRAARRAEAVVDGDRVLTYGELAERAARVGSGMLAAGLEPGDRVAVVLGNRLEYPEIAAGLAMAGLPMVPLNPRLSGREMAYILGHSSARAVIVDDAHGAPLAEALGEVEVAVRWSIDGSGSGEAYEAALARARAVDPAVQTSELDPFCIAYTSGTTGKPKGVVISHRSRCLTFFATGLEWGIRPGRRTIAVAPMYHGAGFAFAYTAVWTGGTVAMLRKWDPERALDMMAEQHASCVFMVPTHAQMIRSLGEDAIRSRDLSSLESLYFNAAAMPHPLKEWVLATFPGVGLYELYGSTEAAVVTCLRTEHQLTKPGSVGAPWYLTEVKLLGLDGAEVGPGEVGELYSRSPYLMSGYLDDPEATAACTTPDGFLSAGDLARADEDGFLSIVDRKKDMIVTGGSNVYPKEVEDVLVRHPAVDQVAVLGLPDEQWGELVTAAVVLRPGQAATEADLDAYARRELAGYKLPKRYEFRSALPSSAAGKILKRDLREELGAGG
jgi:acyl-CoA synthetase (AMP-forming)/AMP-acid ligase II